MVFVFLYDNFKTFHMSNVQVVMSGFVGSVFTFGTFTYSAFFYFALFLYSENMNFSSGLVRGT